MTAIMRHFRSVLADESAIRSVTQEAREIVRRAEVNVERYKTESAFRKDVPIVQHESESRKKNPAG